MVVPFIVEKSRAPRPYYVDHHEAVSHQDVTTDYLAQDTKGSVIITVSWFPGCPAINWLTASASLGVVA